MEQKNNSLDKVVSQVDHLTPEELLYLKEAMDNPELVNALWASDYEEIPVDIETFITDKRYLGSSFTDDEGKSLIYKFWRDELKNNIFNPDKPIYELALSGCLSGDTKLKLLDREVTIEDLYYQHLGNPRNNGKDTIEYTYSYDMETDKIVVGEIVRVFTTGINDLYEITLDNGEKIKCTPDHKFLCRDKHYRTINHGLEVGTSLMPFNCSVNEQGYECIQHPRNGVVEPLYRVVAQYKYGQNYHNVVKHKDKNLFNNHPSNLLRINCKDQIRMYSCCIWDCPKIVSIKYIGKQKTYNITIKKHHNYVLNGIISGNCIGSGKSTCAIICMAYILYKLLCLRDPAAYYKLTKGSRIALAFFNLSIDQAYAVSHTKLQSYLQASPWFQEHGKIYGREGYRCFYPDKDIRIVVGSRMEHFIGLDIFCLTGDTLIETENGPIEIKQLQNNPMKVYDSRGILSDFPVYSIETMKTSDLIEIELENGEIVRCTPNHKFMLKDGTFKEAQYLTEDDELKEI